MTESRKPFLRSMVEDNDNAIDEVRVVFLAFSTIWAIGALYTLFFKPDMWLETLSVGAVNFGLAAINSRYQERKENVVAAVKPADSNVDVQA